MQCRRCACHPLTCRLDEKEPTCSQCERLGYSCPGTQSTTVFIDENTRFKAEKSVSSYQSPFPSTGASQSQPVSTEVIATVPIQETWLRAQSTAWGESLTIDGEWNLDLPKEAYYTNFVVNKLNIGRIQSAFSFLRPGLAAAHDDSHLPYLFTHSFAKAFFGQYYRMPSVIADAQAEYGNQLLVLNKNLNMPGSTDYVSLFYGIMAAVMYEFVTVTMPDAWSWHISALAEIVEVSRILTDPIRRNSLLSSLSARVMVPRPIDDSTPWSGSPCVACVAPS